MFLSWPCRCDVAVECPHKKELFKRSSYILNLNITGFCFLQLYGCWHRIFIVADITLIPLFMQFITGTPLGVISDARETIEIKLWETYLLHDRTNLPFVLNQFSIDHGPVENVHHEPGRITYRFSAEDWENEVKHLLYENRIPVIIKPSVIHRTARIKQPVFA